MFAKVKDLNGKEEEKNIACCLSLFGDDGINLYNNFTFETGKEKGLKEIKQKFKDHYDPR